MLVVPIQYHSALPDKNYNLPHALNYFYLTFHYGEF